MISQGQFARQHDIGGGGSGESVVQFLVKSNMEVVQSNNREMEAIILDKSCIGTSPSQDNCENVISKVSSEIAANEIVVHEWQDDDPLTSCDDGRQDELDTKTTSADAAEGVDMSSDNNMLLDANSREGGMKTRGNR